VSADEYPLLLTFEQARRLAGYGEHTFRRMVKTGEIPADVLYVSDEARHPKYRRDALIAWAAGRAPRRAA
jgi:hypothetical protein